MCIQCPYNDFGHQPIIGHTMTTLTNVTRLQLARQFALALTLASAHSHEMTAVALRGNTLSLMEAMGVSREEVEAEMQNPQNT
jgi:hypothetical protein